MNITRRHILAASAIVPIAACGIVTTTGNSVSINVAQIDAWGQAFLNAAGLVLTLPGLAVPYGALVTALIPVIKADLAAFDASAGGKVTLTFDASSVPAGVSSLLADGKQLLTDVTSVPGLLADGAASTANTYVQAIATIVSIFSAAVGSVSVGAASGGMTEGQALAVLHVK